MDIRAYINPQPALSEADQRRLVDPHEPAEVYVETRNETREDWIESLQSTSVALVPRLFVLAKAVGRKDNRIADLLLAKDEIHGAGSYILEADTGHRSSDRKHWSLMLARAKGELSGAVKKGKVGKQPYDYTGPELRTMQAIMESRNYSNWPERRDAMLVAGVKLAGRTWCYTILPRLIKQLMDDVPPAKLPRKRPARVYFIRDGEAVKIGFSQNPAAVLKALARGNHRELKLLGTVPGGRTREAALRRQFEKFQIKNRSSGREWFVLSPAIKAYITRHCK